MKKIIHTFVPLKMIMESRRKIVSQGEALLKYLPHRPPVLLVDTFFGREPDASYTGYTPRTGSFFCPGDYFLEEGLIEHAAQSIALAAGLERVQNQSQVEPGFVGSINAFTTYGRVPSGTTIYTIIRELYKYPGFSVMQAETFCQDMLVTRVEMKVVKITGSVA
ncbi:MAG: hypothetical protein PHT64_02375 [Bacteroidales bacterium]|nr:hypothetical protein [Bacteroidales bacterium]MDD3521388.1 hypothetical protein [Bacteroidales bacterium]MDD4029840.1 hypothetical protein [Bacteroidales bacterium]MDD4434927.1 hypothetical protein [Bacteroidales bacterium]MDD5732625.1 hypothetical protein [Bacteroidales bacterium]